ncbi:kinesin-like protein KIF18A [Drosophila pseudoobscura]|uniref:Kinesin-like protein KIF18A n=1 Tax=Drosophila pseudoobscura pseudoobscura TaxID=46245 RepID=A0A6I8UEP9_DROPS|nr:kinesin-like protein KIF18A [Drosophila pseudoobscura]
MPVEHTNIKVAVRVRPYNAKELEHQQRSIIKVMDKSALLFDPDEEDDEFFFHGTKQNYRDITKRMNKKLTMEFDRVFDIDNTNQELFEECTAPLVDAVLNGYNCSVFVYGATGAGKTFTMLGSEATPGITFLTMRDLFEKIQAQSDARKFDVGVSYLEVYNEHVMNLLTKSGPLKLREDSNGVVVSGLRLTPIYSAEELLRMLALGNGHRTQHPTDANAESSRSHAIFQVHIRITDRKTDTKRTVKLSMIDLAGSERAASTKGIGVRFKEGASINKSLLALGNCINKLADGLKHIPYRDSNLTRILKDSLGGNCRTLMVANVSMSSLTYEDTYNTLKYASRAKKIRTTLKQNVIKSKMPTEFYVKKIDEVMAENERLKERNKALEAKVAQLERGGSNGYDPQELKSWYSRIDAVYATAKTMQECGIGIRSKIKIINYRQTLKKDFEEFRKMLSQDQRMCQEDYRRFNNYMTTLANQNDKYSEELPSWQDKVQHAYREVESLKREVNQSKLQQILGLYVKRKDLELQMAKQNISSNHLYLINRELVENSDLIRKSFTTACDVLCQAYNRLEDAEKLTPEIQALYDRLHRKMRFAESEANATEFEANETEKTGHKRLLASEEDEEQSTTTTASAKKRQFVRASEIDDDLHLSVDSTDSLETDSDSDEAHKTFKKPHNLNQTQVLSTTYNALTSTVTKQRNVHQRIVTDLLSDQNVRGGNDKIKQVLLKSSNFTTQGLQRSLAAASIAKENVKFNGNYVRKSPRALVAKAMSGNPTITRKPLGTGNKEPPLVKFNRAASFRLKK